MTLSLTITGQSDSKLKLAWRDDDQSFHPAPYCVGQNTLRDASQQLRDVLTRLSTHYRTTDAPSYAGFLAELSQRGFELHESLFLPPESGQDAADDVKAYIGDLTDRQALTIYSDASVHVPWGFVFPLEAPLSKESSSGTLADFKDFWSSRFRITTRFSKTSALRECVRNRMNFRVLYVLHKDAFQRARSQLPASDQQCLDRLVAQEAANAVDWNSARDKWRAIAENDSIIYIFGHSNGKEIALSDGDEPQHRLSAGSFRVAFRKSNTTKSATICFTNGCWTAVGDGDQSFLTATALPGFHGFIGSEAEVSNDFATRYGLEFMRDMCDHGWSIQETFDHLRQALFPLSLLYSCFAHGKFQIQPPGKPQELPPAVTADQSHAA
jgi:hypothetical protein